MNLFELFTDDLDEGIHDPGIFKAVFVAGPPGAGKDTVINALGLPATGLKMQDIDRTMYFLRKAKGQLTGNIQNPTDAEYKDSLRTTLNRQRILQQSMLGLLINTTGRDAEHLLQLNRELKKFGYDTFMVFINAEHDVASSRISNREQHGKNPWDRRKVDQTYFNDAYQKSRQNADFYALSFGNNFAYVTNNVRSQETTEDINDDEFNSGIKVAAKKVRRFLQEPLSDKAKQIVAAASPINKSL